CCVMTISVAPRHAVPARAGRGSTLWKGRALMSTPKPAQHMILTTFMLPAGYHKDSWRMDGSRAEELGNLDFVLELTQMAEAAKLDAVFFGDVVHANTLLRGDIKMNGF